jgi:hypothetical protein
MPVMVKAKAFDAYEEGRKSMALICYWRDRALDAEKEVSRLRRAALP